MQRQFKGLLYYLSTDFRYSVPIFWAILISILLLSIVSSLFIGKGEVEIAFNLSAPIYILAAIMGFLTVKNSLPYLIKMGSTRKNLFIGVAVHFIGFAFFNAIIANTIYSVTEFFIKDGMLPSLFVDTKDSKFYFTHLEELVNNNSWLSRVIVDTSISLLFITVMFVIGLMYYRFGLIGGFLFIGVITGMIVIGMATGWLPELAVTIFSDFQQTFFYQLFFVAFLIYSGSYIVLRRISILH